jgi:cellulose synthase/poly-beta-1,6-N-acetylglucosamine synthase-like glycosyltransferase
MAINPLITVLIPCHSTLYLQAALESIAIQTLDKDLFEVLVIVDRVDPIEVKELLLNAQFQFRVLSSPNPGIVAALNFGLYNTSAELIARMDEDDLMTSRRLEVQKKFLERNRDYAAVGGQIELINSTNKTIGFSNYPLTLQRNSIKVLKQSPLPHPGTMFRRSVVLELGGYRGFLPEDWDLWVRINEQWKIANIRNTVLKYRVHSKQLSRQQTYTSPRGALAVAASQLARGLGLQDHPIDSESVEDWVDRLDSNANFHNGMIQLQLLQQRTQPFRASILVKKTGLSKLVSIFDFLRKDFLRHLPILYRTFRHKIRI